MTLNCIWWWGYDSGDVEFGIPLHCHDSQLPLWPRVVISVRAPSKGQVELFENYLYLIGLWAKNTFKNQLDKKGKYEHTMTAIS